MNDSPDLNQVNLLAARLASTDARIAVLGLGVAGLELALHLAERGYQVQGYDTNLQRIKEVNAGRSPFPYLPDSRIRLQIDAQRLRACPGEETLGQCDVVLICVPTPLNIRHEPDMGYIQQAGETIRAQLRPGQLVILESSTYPGATAELLKPLLEAGGLKVGREIFLAYSPERFDPGNASTSLAAIPKVVGADDPHSRALALAFYRCAFATVVPVSGTAAAEAAKLLENTYRLVNLALVDELKEVWAGQGIDIWEVVEAAATKPFGYQAFYPGPGVGGHCIPVDPLYLTWKAAHTGQRARLVELAAMIIEDAPRKVFEHIAEALNNCGKSVRDARVLLLGVAYKANVGDTRETPAYPILKRLQAWGALVDYHDPFVPRWQEAGLASQELTRELLEQCDCAVVLTDHDGPDYRLLDEVPDLPVLDSRNVMRRSGLRPRRLVQV